MGHAKARELNGNELDTGEHDKIVEDSACELVRVRRAVAPAAALPALQRESAPEVVQRLQQLSVLQLRRRGKSCNKQSEEVELRTNTVHKVTVLYSFELGVTTPIVCSPAGLLVSDVCWLVEAIRFLSTRWIHFPRSSNSLSLPTVPARAES